MPYVYIEPARYSSCAFNLLKLRNLAAAFAFALWQEYIHRLRLMIVSAQHNPCLQYILWRA